MGFAPVQVDYSDYREWGGVKVPYKTIVTWLDGKSVIEFNEVRANVPVDAQKFARPSNR